MLSRVRLFALQCSCLENPRDGGAWWAAVYGVAQSRTRLARLSSSSRGAPVGFLRGKVGAVGQGHSVRLAGSYPSARRKYVLLGRKDSNKTDAPASTRPCPERGVAAAQAASVLTTHADACGSGSLSAVTWSWFSVTGSWQTHCFAPWFLFSPQVLVFQGAVSSCLFCSVNSVWLCWVSVVTRCWWGLDSGKGGHLPMHESEK